MRYVLDDSVAFKGAVLEADTAKALLLEMIFVTPSLNSLRRTYSRPNPSLP
jgi:hypothetical protein